MAAMYDQFGNYIGDDGINSAVRTLQETQATTPNAPPGVYTGKSSSGSNLKKTPTPGSGYDASGATGNATAPSQAGAGQHADASQANTPAATAKTVNLGYTTDLVSPQPNVLDNFSSYTYHASVYMLSPNQYRNLVLSKNKSVNSYHLLFQSGGAPANTSGFQGAANMYNQSNYMDAMVGGFGSGVNGPQSTIPGANGPDAGRNPAFPLDFYIDNIAIDTELAGGGSRAAHAINRVKFTVIEPQGITLLDRIYQAAQDMVPGNGAGSINYNALTYLMVIRFYGYDSEGNLVPGIRGASGETKLSDQNAVIEKFIPFKISKLDWSISNRAVVYEFEGYANDMIVATGTRRGTVPYDVQLNAGTLGDLLGTNSVYVGSDSAGTSSTTQPTQAAAGNTVAATGSPPKANAAPTTKKLIKQGLMGAMNDFQEEICKGANAIFSVPDTYKVVWVADKDGRQPIRDATIVLPGVAESASTGFSAPSTQDPGSVDPQRVSKDITTRNFSITAGMQLIQAIDLAIRNSSYIIDQQLVIRNTQTGEEEPNQQKNGQPVKWYTVWFEALPKNYDPMRNDTGYDVTFYIAPFTIEKYDSKYFPLAQFRGVYKQYPIYFTGKNTAVIDYKETLNNLYNLTVSGNTSLNSRAEVQRRALLSSTQDKPFFGYQSASTESRQGTAGVALEPAANLAESFYEPSGQREVTLRIIGDPAWLQQGSFAGGMNAETFTRAPFLGDGTINFDASQIPFLISWQRPEDYDIDTGLANPWNRATAQAGQPGAQRVYVATKLLSEFRQGKFEQTLKGSIYPFPTPSGLNKAVTASPPNTVDPANRTSETQQRTGVDLTNNIAGAGRGLGYQASGSTSADYFNKNTTPAKSVPVAIEPATSETNTQQITVDKPAVTPMATPAPATDGTGQNISLIDNFLNRSSAPPRKINLDTDFVVQGPQEAAPPDP